MISPTEATRSCHTNHDVSICIISYNCKELLSDCIESIRETTKRVSYEIVVVDNDSKDGTVEHVRAHYPDVTLIANPDNRGFGTANNQAIEVAQGRHCLLLNNDTIVLDGAIDSLVAFLDAHPDTAIAGCRMFNSREKAGLHRTCYVKYPTIPNSFFTSCPYC